MSLITPGLLASRGAIMPNRQSVSVFRLLARDEWAALFTVICEVRPEKSGVSGGADGQTDKITREFIFQQIDLGANTVADDDVILFGTKYYRVGGVSVEQQEQRVRCPTVKSVNPLTEID